MQSMRRKAWYEMIKEFYRLLLKEHEDFMKRCAAVILNPFIQLVIHPDNYKELPEELKQYFIPDEKLT